MADPNENQNPMDPLTLGELISLQEAAEYSGLSRHSLSTYMRNGRLRAKKLGNVWVTTRVAIDQYLASRSLENIPKKYRGPS